MKNATQRELDALRTRAARQKLPQVRWLPTGRLDADSKEAVREAASRIFRKNGAVGGTLVLVSPQASEVFCFGHARLNPKTPVTERTCMRVASVSKLVMTFGALSLVEAGQLELDADISGYLGYPAGNPRFAGKAVTLRMLLTHTSGIRDEGNYGTRGMESGCTLRELLDDAQNWTEAEPGAAFHYSNLGAGVVGVIMERAANNPFEDIMQRRVFEPLGVRASYDPRRIQPTAELADGYAVRWLLPPVCRYDAKALAARPPEPFDPERDYLIAAGRLIADAAAMERLSRLLASRDGLGVVSADSLAEMRTPQGGKNGIAEGIARGLNTAFLPGVFPGFSPVGHQGVAYGMCAELFADVKSGCGVGVMTSGVRLVRQPPLMRAGFDLLTLGFGALRTFAK